LFLQGHIEDYIEPTLMSNGDLVVYNMFIAWKWDDKLLKVLFYFQLLQVLIY